MIVFGISLFIGLGLLGADDTGMASLFGAGVTLLSPTHIDILFWLPNTFKLWLVTSIQSFTLIPIAIQIPILLIVVIGLIWGGIKLFLP